jgi:protein TonB
MPRELFSSSVSTRGRPSSRRARLLPISVAVHAAVLAAIVVLPALADGDLPEPRAGLAFHAIDIELPKVPAPAPVRQAPASRPVNRPVPLPGGAPLVTPDRLPTIDPGLYDDNVEIDGHGEMGTVGLPGGIIGGETIAPPVPTPAPAEPRRVGGEIERPVKIRDVKPEYPPFARAAGIQGLVILETVIDERGRVASTRVLRSVPMLDQAAMAAVRQWQFTPTRLNGVPIAVVMTVTIDFRLAP